jgi:O-antigen/teichoic acid export membrane protein
LATYSFSALSTAAVPHFAGLLAQGRNDELRRVVLITTRLSLTVVTPVVLFLWWAGGGVIELWAGKGAFAGDRVLAVLVVMTVLHAIGTPAGLLLQAIGRNKELVTSELANALLNLTLSIVLVQYVGTLGVALGTLIASTLTSTWVVPLVACKKIGLHPRQYIQEGLLRQVAVGMLAFAAMRTIFGATARPLSVATIALIGITSLVVTAVGTYGIGISAAERARLNGFVAVGGTSVSLRWQRSRNESARSKSDPF